MSAEQGHGTESRYSNRTGVGVCRCDACREAHRVYTRDLWRRRRDARVLIDGRLVAPPPAVHGLRSTYNNRSCRCVPCSDARRGVTS